jgi:nucleoside-diphosphate-sugar epimerase
METKMRVLVTGASGAIGVPLVRQLVERGHEVIGTHQSPSSGERIRGLGARPIRVDLLDPGEVRRAVLAATPDAIVHEATALGNAKFARDIDQTFAPTNRLRTEATDALLAAAGEAGVTRFVAQSFAPYRYAREGGWIKSEQDPLESHPPAAARETFAAMTHLDEVVTAAGGTALRYGGFYGADNDGLAPAIRKRMFPIVGDGGGYMSFIHLEDAAAATVITVEHHHPGIFHIVDDEPAPVREWLPVMAAALGAKRPLRVPRWIGRLAGGEWAVVTGTEARGASNAKAKRELGWTPRFPNWRQGFEVAYRTPGRDVSHMR